MATRRRDIRLLILALVVVVAAAAALAWLGARHAGPGETAVSGQAAIGGPFTLTDQNGKTRTEAMLKGHLSLVYFGYTFCPDVCPLALNNMGAAIDDLGSKGDSVLPVFISVDPARDTVARMKEYATRFHPRLVALTGSPEAIAKAAKAYHVYYAKHENEGPNYLVDHSALVYLMGRRGQYLAHFGPNVTPKEMAAKIANYL